MSRRSKIGRNEPCPCLSGKKFKHCCEGTVDWDAIIESGRDYRPYLSLRGRNLYFTKSISAAFQLDELGSGRNSKEYKAAFTAAAVREIHEAVLDIWPRHIDIAAALRRSRGEVSGLYIGDYDSEYIKRAIVRHSIYANKILLVDPFVYPTSVRDEYNPILNPDQYRAQTLKSVNLWFELLPWIEAGIVVVIRPPSDFDPQLNWDLMTAQMKKFEESPELQEASKESVDELGDRHSKRLLYQQLLLGAPDSYLKRKFEELDLGKGGLRFDQFLESIHLERDEDPDFLEPLGPENEGQLSIVSSGASYPGAKIVADLTGSYLFTDIHVKWREIELDRATHSAENKVWAPFAKALQNTSLRYLNGVRLEHALTLRNEGRLESLRRFLTKVWTDASAEDKFDAANAVLLGQELAERISEAELEWRKIDADLARSIGKVAAAGLFAAGPLIAAGHAYFLAAASAVAAGTTLVDSTLKRRSFADRFPAAFFMKIEDTD